MTTEPRKPGRKPTGLGPQTNIAFMPDMLAAIDREAAQQGITRSEWIRRACDSALQTEIRRAKKGTVTVFYVTFGQKYAHEPHPVLGAVPDLPEGWLAVTAPTMGEARAKVDGLIGDAWCDVYDPDDMRTDYYPAGCIGNLENLVAERCECFEVDPKHWTTHYGAVDPATTHEWNPDCPVHGLNTTPTDTDVPF